MGIFGDYGRQIWENGYSVMPVSGKKAFLTGWDKYKDRLATEEEMDEWEIKHYDCNIGIAMGKASGLAGIDVDSLDVDLCAYARSLLPPSPLIKFGQKGFTLFVKYKGQTNRVMRVNGHKIGEFISAGQTVIPPSIHPDTKQAYQWLGGSNMVDFSRADLEDELPDFSDQDLDRFEKAIASGPDFKPASPSESGRNMKLVHLAFKMFEQGRPVEQVATLLYEQDIILHKDRPLFSDGDEYKDKRPQINALLMATSVFKTFCTRAINEQKDIPHVGAKVDDKPEEYDEYAEFFNGQLGTAKKDIISGQVLDYDGIFWQPVLNDLDAIKSHGISAGLKPNKVPIHLGRWMKAKEKQLLVDIPSWDGIDRISSLKDFLSFKNMPFAVFEDALKEWGANIFRRLYEKKAQNRCIILKGSQGIGKDIFISSLLDHFGPYYAKFSSNRDQRECWSQVTGSLVLHIEEFDQTGQMSIPFLKDLITRDWVVYRAPYDRSSQNRKCYGSFISSVNIDAVLRDETGNRRFAVFELESIDWKYPKDGSAQIFAQFYALYKQGFLAKESTWQQVTENNQNYEQVDMTQEYLNQWDNLIAAISKQKTIVELEFKDVEKVISDLCKISGLKTKVFCTMLKVNGRSKKSGGAMVYWSNLRKLTVVNEYGRLQDDHRTEDGPSCDRPMEF